MQSSWQTLSPNRFCHLNAKISSFLLMAHIRCYQQHDNHWKASPCKSTTAFWHVYVLVGVYFVWPWKSCGPHRIRDVTPGSLSATDTCIVYHVTHFEASRNVILHMRYVNTCVGARVMAGVEKQWTKAIRNEIPNESTGSCICIRLDLYMIRYFHH
jgi:hypothetical protein